MIARYEVEDTTDAARAQARRAVGLPPLTDREFDNDTPHVNPLARQPLPGLIRIPTTASNTHKHPISLPSTKASTPPEAPLSHTECATRTGSV